MATKTRNIKGQAENIKGKINNLGKLSSFLKKKTRNVSENYDSIKADAFLDSFEDV